MHRCLSACARPRPWLHGGGSEHLVACVPRGPCVCAGAAPVICDQRVEEGVDDRAVGLVACVDVEGKGA
eukprot:4096445-Pleurochrysis_carterae.AAC.1